MATIGPASARADNVSQGALVHDIADANGVRAYLSNGHANLDGPYGGIIATVRVEQSVSFDDGLYQAGRIKEGSGLTTNCGSGPMNATMVEREYEATGNKYCNPYFGIGSYPDDYLFRIKHTPDGWVTLKENDQVLDGPYTLGFATGKPIAIHEKRNGIESASMTWGPSGSTPWQRYNSGTGVWHTISDAYKHNFSGWEIGTAPSPFVISR